jgi:hypothetical protein
MPKEVIAASVKEFGELATENLLNAEQFHTFFNKTMCWGETIRNDNM